MSELKPGNTLFTLDENGNGQGWRIDAEGVPVMDDRVDGDWAPPATGSRPSTPTSTKFRVLQTVLAILGGVIVGLMIYAYWDGNDALMPILALAALVLTVAIAVVTSYERRLFRGRLVRS